MEGEMEPAPVLMQSRGYGHLTAGNGVKTKEGRERERGRERGSYGEDEDAAVRPGRVEGWARSSPYSYVTGDRLASEP